MFPHAKLALSAIKEKNVGSRSNHSYLLLGEIDTMLREGIDYYRATRTYL